MPVQWATLLPLYCCYTPEEGTLLSGGDSVDSARQLPGSLSYRLDGSVMDISSDSPSTVAIILPQEVFLVDATSSLHPFFMHRLDVGPIHLTTISHAFNYRVAVLRNGVKSATRVGRSRRATEQFLEDGGIPWGHQVAVMFQIVCVLALEVPLVLQDIESLNGVSPNVSLSCEPWGHTHHTGGDCTCLSSGSTDAYVHGLSLATEGVSPMEEGNRGHLYRYRWGWCADGPASWRGRRAPRIGAICAYGHLLLVVYVQWKTGHLVAFDWLHPVTREGWRSAPPVTERSAADVS